MIMEDRKENILENKTTIYYYKEEKEMQHDKWGKQCCVVAYILQWNGKKKIIERIGWISEGKINRVIHRSIGIRKIMT